MQTRSMSCQDGLQSSDAQQKKKKGSSYLPYMLPSCQNVMAVTSKKNMRSEARSSPRKKKTGEEGSEEGRAGGGLPEISPSLPAASFTQPGTLCPITKTTTMDTKKEVVISIPRTAKSSSAAAPPSLLSGMTPPSPPGEPLALKNQTRQVGPQPQQMPQQPQRHHQPQQPYRQHQYHPNQQGGPHHRNLPPPNLIIQRPPSATDPAPPSFSSSQLPQYPPPMINVNTAAIPQPLPPLSDAQKKTLRHLDTLVEVVSKKIADQMERNMKMDVIPTDPSGGNGVGSREYKRQREQQGNVDVVSRMCMFDKLFASSRVCPGRTESYTSLNVLTSELKQHNYDQPMRLGYTWCSFRCRDDDRYLHYERLFSIKLLKLLSLTNATSHFSPCGKKLRQFSTSLVPSSPTKITGTISSTLIQRPIPSWYRRCPTEASRYFLKISRLGRRNGR